MRKIAFLLLTCLIAFTGCASNTTSDIFAVPQMPETHKALLDIINTVLEDGYEYSEPRSGIYRQSVQLMDLDGDGEEEGVVFLRDVLKSYKTSVYIFKKDGNTFSLLDTIGGSENDIYTVSYSNVVGEDGYEMIIEWGENSYDTHPVEIYSKLPDSMKKILDVSAKQYSVSDIDSDGKNEVLTVVEQDGAAFADIYTEDGGMLSVAESLKLSDGGGSILRIKNGNIAVDKKGVFIEREKDLGVITDVISYSNGKFLNLLSKDNICINRALCTDVNGDGIIEIPHEAEKDVAPGGNDACYSWANIGADGVLVPCAFTYHSFSEDWYIVMPASWISSVYTGKAETAAGQIEVLFLSREPIAESPDEYRENPLFKIHILTGDNREQYAGQAECFVISERENATFTAEIISGSHLGTVIDEGFLKNAFKIRESEWATEILFAQS